MDYIPKQPRPADIPRPSDNNLRRKLKGVEEYRRWYERLYMRSLSSEQIGFEKAKIIIDEIDRVAEDVGERRYQFDQRLQALVQDYTQVHQAQQNWANIPANAGLAVPAHFTADKTAIVNRAQELHKQREKFQKECMDYLHNQYKSFFVVYRAEKLAKKQFWQNLFIATSHFLNEAGIKVANGFQDGTATLSGGKRSP